MKKIIKILAFILTFSLNFNKNVYAVLPNEGGSKAQDFDIASKFGPATIFSGGLTDNVPKLITIIIYILIFIAGALALIFIISAGLQMVTSGGDAKKLQAAGSRLTFAVIGLAVVVLAFIIVGFVQRFLGSSIEITN